MVKNLQKRALHYLRNDVPSAHHRIALRLRGTRSNRDAVGARVMVEAGGRKRTKEVRSASGFLSQSPAELFFGLGGETKADVRIRWPSGLEQELPGLEADRRYLVVEGEPAVAERRYTNENHHGLAADPFPAENERPAVIFRPRPAPGVPADAVNEAARGRRPAFTRTTLVCFLTSWCASCREDVALLERLFAEKGRRFDVLAVQVVDPRAPEAAGVAFDALPFPVHRGAPAHLEAWRQAAGTVVPVSFVVTKDGMIRRVHVGRIDEARLRKDLAELASGR